MSLTNAISDLAEWLASLSAEFAFLLALPFVVALAGLLRYALRRARDGHREPSAPAGTHARLARER